MREKASTVTIMKLILLHGTDVNARSIYDETALKLAAESGHMEIVELLRTAGAYG